MFVSPQGSDELGAGTRAAPLRSLALGVSTALAENKRLYLCGDAGSYSEKLSLTEQAAGLEIYGRFRCSDWVWQVGIRSEIKPQAGFALEAEGLSGAPVHIDGIHFEAAAGSLGEHSIAGFVRNSLSLRLVNSLFVAGRGGAGEPGVSYAHPGVPYLELMGAPGDGPNGGPGQSQLCDYGGGDGVHTEGGPGGTSQDDTPRPWGRPELQEPSNEGGMPGLSGKDCSSKGGGLDGNPGAPGSQGAGALVSGELSVVGWVGESGRNGTRGGVAQGGGGGRAGSEGGGGGGGAGGCGGLGGGGGGAGGSSVALLLFNAPIVLEEVMLVADEGGLGGSGAQGQAGWSGGVGGEPAPVSPNSARGCAGGGGGSGGPGGGGGGGAGGLSVGIFYAGQEPARIGGDIYIAQAGQGGDGGLNGLGLDRASQGLNGVSAASLKYD